MKKTIAVLTGGIIACVILLLLSSLSQYSSKDEAHDGEVEDIQQATSSSADFMANDAQLESWMGIDTTPVRAEYKEPSREQPSASVSEYAEAVEMSEVNIADPPDDREYTPLESFGRPYFMTLGEADFQMLSPEDQARFYEDITPQFRDMRRQALDTVSRAKAAIDNGNHSDAETYLISVLETGRQLNGSVDNLVTTQLFGIGHQAAALNEMVRLYTMTGQRVELAMAQDELKLIKAQMDDIKAMAAEKEQ